MERPFDHVAVIVLDGVGCGEAADAGKDYARDVGANSLLHAAAHTQLRAPELAELGLPYVPGLEGINVGPHPEREKLRGAFGALQPTHPDNGSPGGHEALMGLQTKPFTYYTAGFPPDLIADIERVAAEIVGQPVEVVRFPSRDSISGTDFIAHPDVGSRIWASRDAASGPLRIGVYTSSDSVVQIATHNDIVSLGKMKDLGRAVRQQVLIGPERGRIGRVIMRPFTGADGNFKRDEPNRTDFAIKPDGPTLIDFLTEAGIPVEGLGKFGEMFDYQGFPEGSVQKLGSDDHRMLAVLHWLAFKKKAQGLNLVNLKNTDEKYGHRRDPMGYIHHLARVSTMFALMKHAMNERDLLILTADHGNDPTHTVCADDASQPHTDHTRENVPLLAFSQRMKGPIELGMRGTFEDLAATLAENFGVQDRLQRGTSFLRELVS